ncbi:MAG: copper chaperone PCu(A)C [Chlorobi bacterium]|nr:copper chaperone PCu(A)C [Chlorobiota bacterium]
MKLTLIGGTLFVVFTTICASQTVAIEVRDGWMYSADSGMVTGAFMTIESHSTVPDTIVAVRTECAEHTEIHTTVRNSDGTMGMRPIAELIIPPKKAVVLKPRSLHVMLYHLRRSLRSGDRCIVYLTSKRHGDLRVELRVRR